MFRTLCNKLFIRASSVLRPVLVWGARRMAAAAGLPLLPPGFSMFSDALAKEIGVERAVMHQKLKGWQEYNRRRNKRSHFRQGKWWTYGKPEYWQQNEFIWTSLSTVRRAFRDLEKAGLLLRDEIGGDLWLCAVAGEAVNLTPQAVNLQMELFNLESDASNRRSSIVNPTSSSEAIGKRTNNKPRAPRKAAVAVFNIPESRNEVDVEIRENPEHGDEGHDELAGLPGQLVTDWTDQRVTLGQFVAKHGVSRINQAWKDAAGFDSQIAGMRTLLKKAPLPPAAPPPSHYDTLEAGRNAWQRQFEESPYRHFFDPVTPDPDATPEIDPSEFEAVTR